MGEGCKTRKHYITPLMGIEPTPCHSEDSVLTISVSGIFDAITIVMLTCICGISPGVDAALVTVVPARIVSVILSCKYPSSRLSLHTQGKFITIQRTNVFNRPCYHWHGGVELFSFYKWTKALHLERNCKSFNAYNYIYTGNGSTTIQHIACTGSWSRNQCHG